MMRTIIPLKLDDGSTGEVVMLHHPLGYVFKCREKDCKAEGTSAIYLPVCPDCEGRVHCNPRTAVRGVFF